MKKITINRALLYLMCNKKLKFIPDKQLLKLKYRLIFNKKLDLDNPKSFNEKLQWLKLNDRKDVYTIMVDKYASKSYVAKIIGDDKIVKNYGVWDNFDDIDFDKLPEKFVLKPTHTSGNVFICKDKKKIDKKALKKQVNKWLKNEYYYIHREWPYKNIPPRIIAEEYLENEDNTSLKDYKFYCFNGKSKYTMICTDRETGHPKFYYYDRNGVIQKDMSQDGLKLEGEPDIIIPENLEEMFEVAEKLTKELTFCRLDLYNVNGKIYFSEYTFFPSAGFDDTRPPKCKEYMDRSLNIKGRIK